MGENKLAMIVLAGGASSRMGKEKSDLKLDGKSFLEIQIQKGSDLGVGRIYVSGYRGAHCTEEIVMDRRLSLSMFVVPISFQSFQLGIIQKEFLHFLRFW